MSSATFVRRVGDVILLFVLLLLSWLYLAVRTAADSFATPRLLDMTWSNGECADDPPLQAPFDVLSPNGPLAHLFPFGNVTLVKPLELERGRLMAGMWIYFVVTVQWRPF